MTHSQKLVNDQYFLKILNSLNEGGMYFWPNQNEMFFNINGKLTGTEKGIREIKNITTSVVHTKLSLKS